MKKAYFFRINGITQSVGFRPFIYKLFSKESGWVRNSAKGVELYIETEKDSNFIEQKIIENLPKNAKIENIDIQQHSIKRRAFNKFFIRKSSLGKDRVFLPPDFGICDKCSTELLEKTNRRYLHPFINCTDCGPRFSIVFDSPYDRDKTTMKGFKMCKKCEDEYKNPQNRRFHAEPIACKDCGPSYFLIKGSKVISKNIEAVKQTAKIIENGQVILIKGIGGYHLVCDALNKRAIDKIKFLKKRESKPFAFIAKDLSTIKKHCFVNSEEEKILQSQIKPIVLLKSKADRFGSAVFGSPYIGAMLPYAPLHMLLFHFGSFEFIVATSANISEESLIYQDISALNFAGVDYILTNNRKIVRPLEDSIVQIIDNQRLIYRFARGFAPGYFFKKTKPGILSVGGDLKNNIALTDKDRIIMSQYTPTLENYSNYKKFKEKVEDFINFFNIKPEAVVCDKHPGYFSSEYARQNFKNVVEIQHHVAHFCSVLYEKNIEEAIGVIMDGTGYGDDGNVWGGEFFIKTAKNIERIGHIKYMPFAFGDKAIKEPYRLAVLWLYDILGNDFENFAKNICSDDNGIIKTIEFAHKNSIKTSSAGRLFDVVSAILGIGKISSFEAESAIKLQYSAMKHKNNSLLPYTIKDFEIDFKETLLSIVKRPSIDSAYAFHNTFSNALLENIIKIKKATGIKSVALSGGVFQNEIIFFKLKNMLENAEFKVYYNTETPVNDGGLALGQVYFANMVM